MALRQLGLGVALVTGLVGLGACSANDGGGDDGLLSGGSGAAPGAGGSGNGGSSQAGSSNAGSSNAGNNSGGSGFSFGGNVNGGTSNGGNGGTDTCGGDRIEGELTPVDIHIMLDLSGSMSAETVPGGPNKWEAVKRALEDFIAAPESAGLGVGLQYFPLLAAGKSWTCRADNDGDCGGGTSVCLDRVCWNLLVSGAGLFLCENNGQCGLGGQCVLPGECANDPTFTCPQVGGNCGAGPSGQQLGACVSQSNFACSDVDSCLVGDYRTPAVEIGALPGNAAALQASLAAQEPRGATPTGPALQGAINHAIDWANQNPTHKVVVVLATDGTPTSCNPTDIGPIANLAAQALGNNPSISTYVIGVFGQDEAEGRQNANTIAQSGGTNGAFIVDPNSMSASQEFIAALEEIRGASISCDFQIPTPTTGTVEYDLVNVVFTSGGADTDIFYVQNAQGCDPQNGGWYYDQDPDAGGTPTTIVVCPQTCEAFNQGSGGTVDIKLGCPRQPPPK